MADNNDTQRSRRTFLRTSLAAGGTMIGGAALGAPQNAANPKNLPPNVPSWTQALGDGVAVRAYGRPSKHEAHVIRRDVEWLTASRESSVSFTPLHDLDGIITPSGVCFERHHSGIAEVNPADYRLIIHGLVDKPLIFTLDDIKRMPRVNRAHFCECAANSGMEWRGAQLNGCQFTHGMVHNVMYTGVPLTEREWSHGNNLPDRIILFQLPHEREAEDLDDLIVSIGETLIHEIGHYFGLSEEEIEHIEDEYWHRHGRAD